MKKSLIYLFVFILFIYISTGCNRQNGEMEIKESELISEIEDKVFNIEFFYNSQAAGIGPLKIDREIVTKVKVIEILEISDSNISLVANLDNEYYKVNDFKAIYDRYNYKLTLEEDTEIFPYYEFNIDYIFNMNYIIGYRKDNFPVEVVLSRDVIKNLKMSNFYEDSQFYNWFDLEIVLNNGDVVTSRPTAEYIAERGNPDKYNNWIISKSNFILK